MLSPDNYLVFILLTHQRCVIRCKIKIKSCQELMRCGLGDALPLLCISIAVIYVFFLLIVYFLLKPSLARYGRGMPLLLALLPALLPASSTVIYIPAFHCHFSNSSNPNCGLKCFGFFPGAITNSWKCERIRSLVVKEKVPDFAAVCLFQVREHFYIEISRKFWCGTSGHATNTEQCLF